MVTKRKIEIFSAGCPACETAISRIRALACSSCEIIVLDMKDTAVAARAERLGIASVPAVVIDDEVAACCAGRGPDENTLKAAGLGVPMS